MVALMHRTGRFQKLSNSHKLRHFLLSLGILIVATAVAAIIIKTAPKPERNQAEKKVRLVEIMPLERMSIRPTWQAGGEVSAAQRVNLAPQIAGRISAISENAIPGAEVSAGQVLAQIEKQDYQLHLQQKQAAVIQAQAEVDLEIGQGLLAKEEYELALSQLDHSLADDTLVLRKPQIAAAKAGLKNAQANLALAQLKLDRSDIRMPFNGQIISRSIDLGSQVNANSLLFDVVGTDEFWLQVKVPQQFLHLLDKKKSVIIKRGEWQRQAEIIHGLLEVDASDRQAKVLISIKHPLLNASDASNLLLGSYIECILFAKPLTDHYVLSSQYLKDDGTVWVVNNNKLYKRKVDIAYQGREKVWLSAGFQQGDALLTSNVGVVTQGTAVRLRHLGKVK